MPDNQILNPQSVGDLIGRAIRIYRKNLRPWAQQLFWPTILVLVGRVMYQSGAGEIPKMDSSSNMVAIAIALVGMCIGALIVFVGKWFLLIKQLSFVRLATGLANSPKEAEAQLKRRQWTAFGLMSAVFSMMTAVSVLWCLELVVSGILSKVALAPSIAAILFGTLGLFVSVSFIFFAMFISLCAFACEEGGVTTLLSRGFTMSGKSFMRTMMAGTAIWLTINIVATPLWIPVSIVGAIDSLRLSGTMAANGLPVYWQVFISAWETLIEMVTQPILFLAFGYYYYDLRMRFEGVDVIGSLERLQAKQLQLSDSH